MYSNARRLLFLDPGRPVDAAPASCHLELAGLSLLRFFFFRPCGGWPVDGDIVGGFAEHASATAVDGDSVPHASSVACGAGLWRVPVVGLRRQRPTCSLGAARLCMQPPLITLHCTTRLRADSLLLLCSAWLFTINGATAGGPCGSPRSVVTRVGDRQWYPPECPRRLRRFAHGPARRPLWQRLALHKCSWVLEPRMLSDGGRLAPVDVGGSGRSRALVADVTLVVCAPVAPASRPLSPACTHGLVPPVPSGYVSTPMF